MNATVLVIVEESNEGHWDFNNNTTGLKRLKL